MTLAAKPFLRALAGELVTPPPCWLMRQAGRFLPEYRAVRAEAGGFLNLCYAPEKACEVTLQPLRRYGFDAAILFSDILIVPHLLGQPVAFAQGEGPVLGTLPPVDAVADFSKAEAIWQTVRLIKQNLDDSTALIGFAGSPFTVACYMVEGGSSADYATLKSWVQTKPDALDALLAQISEATYGYLMGQIEAGAEVVQLFESWAQLLQGADFERFIIKPTAALVARLKARFPDVPIIGFPRAAQPADILAYATHTGINGLGLGQEVDLEWACQTIPSPITLQGNLDPELLVQGGAAMDAAIDKILGYAARRPWIFNLGHGIPQTTPPDHVANLIARVRGYR